MGVAVGTAVGSLFFSWAAQARTAALPLSAAFFLATSTCAARSLRSASSCSGVSFSVLLAAPETGPGVAFELVVVSFVVGAFL